MAKFIFKMESILSVKGKLEEQAKAEYGLAVEKLREEEEKYKLLEKRKEEYQERLKQSLVDHLEVKTIKRLEDHVENLKYQMRLQMVAVANAKRQVELASEKLSQRMKERKTYEKLKEKAFENFKLEIAAQEQKEVDELVSFRFGKKESED